MKVEEVKRSVGSDFRTPRDQFPVGMRVLAVDDDPTCLKLLETFLLRCQYHVTTTGQAVTALKLLRENKDKFDLVISDVHMPDMDGFKLLELVGLEMDLPVIMLSGNSDTKAVMKGITHGACDYLLKPVRIEELKNIWQHVVRRRKFDSKGQINSDNEDGERCNFVNGEGQGSGTSTGSDRNGKLNKRRKDEDDNDGADNEEEDEDPSNPKKPRVVWSIELHQKFVAAIRQLGVEKAVPKRILDLMNVEGLTRENVASHLQKYRLYLKRLTTMTTQQANMVAALRARDPYMSAGSFNSFGSYHALAGSANLPSQTGFGSNTMLGRMNSPNGHGWHTLSSSGMIQFGSSNTIRNSTSDSAKSPGVQHTSYQHGNLLQGIPTSLDLDQLEQNKIVQKVNSPGHGGLASNELSKSNGGSSVTNFTRSSIPSHSTQQHIRLGSGFIGNSSPLVDLGRCKDTLEVAAPLASSSGNARNMSTSISSQHLLHGNLTDNNISKAISHTNNFHNLPSSKVVVPIMQNSVEGSEFQNQTLNICSNMILEPNTVAGDLNFMNYTGSQSWGEQTLDRSHDANLIFSTLNSSLPNGTRNEHTLQHQEVKNSLYNNRLDGHVPTQINHDTEYTTQQTMKGQFAMDAAKLQHGFSSNNCSLDDIVNGNYGISKPEQDDMTFMDGDIGCDIFSLGVDVS